MKSFDLNHHYWALILQILIIIWLFILNHLAIFYGFNHQVLGPSILKQLAIFNCLIIMGLSILQAFGIFVSNIIGLLIWEHQANLGFWLPSICLIFIDFIITWLLCWEHYVDFYCFNHYWAFNFQAFWQFCFDLNIVSGIRTQVHRMESTEMYRLH